MFDAGIKDHGGRPARGYCVILRPAHAASLNPVPLLDEVVRRSPRKHAAAVEEAAPKSTDVFKVLHCYEEKGNGAFPLRDLYKGEIVCQYLGQIIDLLTLAERCEDYNTRGKPPCEVWMGEGNNVSVLDAHCRDDGSEYTDQENLGRMLNHKKYNPNCKLVRRDGKCYIVTRRPVAAGVELLWNYGDRKNVEEWEND